MPKKITTNKPDDHLPKKPSKYVTKKEFDNFKIEIDQKFVKIDNRFDLIDYKIDKILDKLSV